MKYYGKLSRKGEPSFFSQVDATDAKTAKNIMKTANKGWRISGFGEYLTEAKMYFYLKENFQNTNFIYDKPLSDENDLTKNIKPDFRYESINIKGKNIKLIIEFDGEQHYTKALEVLKDNKKDQLYKERGYEVIRFPYFIQLTEEIVEYYFGKNMKFDNSYKHGFVDKKAILPSDFCELGIERFMKELNFYNSISSKITTSIIETLKDVTLRNKRWYPIIPDFVIREKYHDELKKYGW